MAVKPIIYQCHLCGQQLDDNRDYGINIDECKTPYRISNLFFTTAAFKICVGCVDGIAKPYFKF